ncbi:hypothetical protein [Romboutsia sp.]|nr:hypothetical protein [Romboutsia sp.]HSQ89779.1 hypothetical protein [Romboutsia sp.]
MKFKAMMNTFCLGSFTYWHFADTVPKGAVLSWIIVAFILNNE